MFGEQKNNSIFSVLFWGQILTLVVLPYDLDDFCLLIKIHNNNDMQNLDLWGHIFVVIS